MGFVKVTARFEVDPLVRGLTQAKIKEDIASYLALLDAKPTEARLHEFLASHSYFFNTILRLSGCSPLYSKVKLGHDYEVDFAWFDSGSMGPEWRLAEIESPTKPMFTKAGEPSAAFLHAIQQVRDWHTWLHDNADYARKLMPYIEYPMGYVFKGDMSSRLSSQRRGYAVSPMNIACSSTCIRWTGLPLRHILSFTSWDEEVVASGKFRCRHSHIVSWRRAFRWMRKSGWLIPS